MSIIRTVHNKENPFAQINKKALRDKDLSLEAVGLWARLLSRPDDWKVSVTELCKSCGCGKDRIYRILGELVKHGYAFRYQPKNENKSKFEAYETVVFEEKKTQKEIQKMFAQRGFPVAENAVTGKADTTKTNLTNTKKTTTTEDSKTEKKDAQKKMSSSSSFSVFDCLKELPITEAKKKELSSEFSEEQVKNAVEYTKTHPIKKSVLSTLFWHCRNDVGPNEKNIDQAKQMAYSHNEIYREYHPDVYQENLKLIPQGKMLIWESKGFDQIAVKTTKQGAEIIQLTEDLLKSTKKFKKDKNNEI